MDNEMTDQAPEQIPFHPQQCPVCNYYVSTTHQCLGFTSHGAVDPLPAGFSGVSTDDCPCFEQRLESKNTILPEDSTPLKNRNPEIDGVPMIHCPKCSTVNPTSSERCCSCDASLLPGESVSQRLIYLIGGILGAAILGYMFYQFYVVKPGSAPDFVLCNAGALGIGAVVVLITAFTQSLRKTPTYLKYENRAKRHLNLNPWQSLADINQAIELAPEKEHGRLLKQRAELHDTLGLKEDAARDHLALATSPDAFKGEGEWVSALTGADADVYTHSRRSSQITSLLKSGNARAVGYCPKCKKVVEVNEDLRCLEHPKTKADEIQYVIPADVLTGKLIVLQKLEGRHTELKTQLTELLNSGEAVAIGYCPRCKAAMELDSTRHCKIHPRVKGRIVQYVVSHDIENGKKTVLRSRRDDRPNMRKRNVLAFGIIIVGIILLLTRYLTQGSGFIDQLSEILP